MKKLLPLLLLAMLAVSCNRPMVQQDPAPIQTRTDNIGDVADWVAYKNDKYKFLVKYPKSIDENQSVDISENTGSFAMTLGLGSGTNIIISANQDLNFFAPRPECAEIMVDNNSGKQCKGLGTSNNYFIETYLKSNNLSYNIQFSTPDQNNSDMIELHNKILSTFKFTK